MEKNMSKGKKFRKESQDARRHDQQHIEHPDEKMKNHHEMTKSPSHSDKRRK